MQSAAGLAGGAYFSGIIEYDRTLAPSHGWAGGTAVAFPALGLSYYRLRIRQAGPAAPTAAASLGRQDQGVLSQFDATLGQSVGEYLVVGSTLKLIRVGGETHGALDLGAMATLRAARFGVVVKNATAPVFGAGGDRLELGRQVRMGVRLMSATPRWLLVQPLGLILRKIAVARFCRTLSTLVSSSVPILDGLEITAKTSGNVVVEDAIMVTRKSIERGETIAWPLKGTRVFPPMVTQMIGVGEATWALDAMLAKLLGMSFRSFRYYAKKYNLR